MEGGANADPCLDLDPAMLETLQGKCYGKVCDDRRSTSMIVKQTIDELSKETASISQ